MNGICEKEQCLKSCSIFNGLDGEAIRMVAETMETETFVTGEDVCLPGEEADRLFVVLQGTFVVQLPEEDVIKARFRAGDIFGEYGMFLKTWTATVRAEEESILLSMDYNRCRAFLLHHPEVIWEMLEITIKRHNTVAIWV